MEVVVWSKLDEVGGLNRRWKLLYGPSWMRSVVSTVGGSCCMVPVG